MCLCVLISVGSSETSCLSTRMPGLPLPDHDAANGGCEISCQRSSDQMCCQQFAAELSPDEQLNPELSSDEQLIPEESLAIYCKPLELYNIIQHRANKNPSYLQRCLLYKIHAKQKKRIKITISLSGSTNKELQAQNLFPLYVLFARPTSNVCVEGHSPIYRFSQTCLLTSFNDSGNSDHTEATFIIPDVETLTSTKAYGLTIILVSCGQVGQHLDENNSSENHVDYSSLQKLAGKCFWGEILINTISSALENCADLILGHTVESTFNICMSPGYLEPKFLEHNRCLSFCSHKVDATDPYQLQVKVSAAEAGAEDILKSPYNSFSYSKVPPSLLLPVIRLRAGNVIFNYKYGNNLRTSEVTENFSCPFCLVRCGNFKGLECHMTSSHDLFHFEFWISKDYQSVNVRLKADNRRTELMAAQVDNEDRIFYYRSRYRRSRRTEIPEVEHTNAHITESGSPEDPEDTQVGSEVAFVQKENENAVIDHAQSLHGSNHSPPALQFGKTRKLSANRDDPRNRLLLQKRQFIHSHKAQPMTMEEVLSDHDSEDEVDDDIADLEDRRMLDDFVDVTKEEKCIMHMWNSFIRKQRILADSHIPWACEAFSRHHGEQLLQNSALLWGWRLFMIKLWNHSLLDARTMDTCNKILDDLKK